MEVKGTAVGSIPEFVRKNFGSRFDEWFGSLSSASSEIMKGSLASSWYPLQEAVVEPTQKICDLFYSGKEKGAWDAGRFSADHGLKGVYKVFVKMGSPEFLISRASKVFASYYRPCEIKVADHTSKRSVVHIVQFPQPNKLIESRIAGWMERALEISGCMQPRLKIHRSLAKGDSVTEFIAEWQ